MKKIFLLFVLFANLVASDATIEVVKKAETLPLIAIEDATQTDYTESFKLRFFKALVADLNVISIFNVDRHHRVNSYDANSVLVANKDMNYILRYELLEGDGATFEVDVKLLDRDSKVLFSKDYRVKRSDIYMFVSHAIAYDINEFMGQEPIEWIKRKVIFAKNTGPKKTEIVIADYTLSYQHTIVKGGFNIFPKWADKNQEGFYYTSLDGFKPVLKYVNVHQGSVEDIATSDGMLVCSDVSRDGTKLLLTMAPKGQPDIYLYDVKTKKYTRETFYSGIDVNAQFMQNGKIVFISSRLGYPNLFSKTLGKSDVEQMVYYGKNNSSCSAHGKYIVYQSRETSNAFSQNTFNLHLISTDTDFIRRLTATGVNEFPRFSSNGDAILFIKNYKAQSAIGIIRLKYNKNYLFPLAGGHIQSLDW